MSSTRTSPRPFLTVLKRRKAAAMVVGWALIIAVFALATPSVTVREQTHPADALPELARAVGDAAGLLAGKPFGFTMSALTSEGGCDITPVRAGKEYSRTVTVYAGEQGSRVAFEALYEGLKKRYRLEPDVFVERPTYSGTGDNYVDFELRQQATTVVWRATTGCRPADDEVGQLAEAFAPKPHSIALLDRLGISAPDWNATSVTCGDLAGPGGSASTATATGELRDDADANLKPLADAAPDGATVAVSSKDLVSYRLGDVSHTVTLDERTVTVHRTQDCDG